MSSPRARLGHLDALRGLVIVLMALDHTRGYFQPAGLSPTDLANTTVPFFLVRWVTHLCAPTFVLLMGVSAALRHGTKPHESTRWLLTRGLWLIFLETTWVTFAWDWDITTTYWGVLWALGGSMVLLALLQRLPAPWMFALGVGLTLLFAVVPVPLQEVPLLLRPGSVTLFGHRIGCSYALLPWFGVAAAGWGAATWLARPQAPRLAGVGLGLLVSFVVVRALQLGDPGPWVVSERGPAFTTVDFVQTSKYPPSLAFLLMTLGVAVLLLPVLGRLDGPIGRWLQRLGQVPMFFYLVHIPLAHLLGNGFNQLVYGTPGTPAEAPLSVPLILAAWAVVVAVLTPVSFWWAGLKARRRDVWWLRYL